MTEYYFVNEHNHEVAVRKGISWLAREAKSAGAGWVAVMEPGNIRFISKYRGLRSLGQLAKAPHLASLYGITLKLITPQKLPVDYEKLSLLALFPSDEYIEKLLSVEGAVKMLVVPWSKRDAEYWIGRCRATLSSTTSTSID